MKRMKTILAGAGALAAAALTAAPKFTVTVPTTDLDEFRKVAELAKELGANHVWATQVEPSLWIWDRNRRDPYPNWGFGHATVFKFVVPEELKKWVPEDYAKRNFEMLCARGKILREFGFKATFNGMEPAYFPEEAYRAHPAWRGPRCDQARRARTEYYAPCFDNAEVRAMYFNAVKRICSACPFDAFSFLTNDSGGGLCWAEGLYPGENGPHNCARIPIGERISSYLSVFQDAARAAGLGQVEASVYHIGDADMMATLPCLKPGQAVNGRSATGKSTSVGVGLADYTDFTFPIWNLPRIGHYARGLQRIRAAGDGVNVSLSFRSLEDADGIDFVKTYFGRIGQGPAAREEAIEKFAAMRVGKTDAWRLAAIWEDIERVVERFMSYETGGHIFMLGTVHQRWLTRPFVAFPEELKPEEKDYYRDFQFQAQEESDADDMSDLQGNKWLKGYGAANLLHKSVRLVLEIMDGAIKSATELSERHASEPYGKDLSLLALRLKAYEMVIRNADHAITFQEYMDRADRSRKPVDTTPCLRHQGDPELIHINEIVREEIDMSYELADLIERAPGRIFNTAPKKEWTTVMHFEPDLSASLRKRAEIMENHRRDFLRLYRSTNR